MRILPVAVLLCLSTSDQHAEAFSTPLHPRRRQHQPSSNDRSDRPFLDLKKQGTSNRRPSSRAPLHYQLSALKKPKTEDLPAALTKSEKVQEMASFLAIQLLGVAMKEISREDGESKMSLEDLQKLTDAISGPVTEPKQAQEKLETTTGDAAGDDDAVEDLLGDEGMTKLDSPPTATATATEKTKAEDPPIAEIKKDVHLEETADIKQTAPKEIAALKEELEKKPQAEAPKAETKPPAVAKSLQSPEGVRIPEVISAEFGKALEVEASNVNPLKHPPKHDPNKKPSVTDTKTNAEAPVAAEKSDAASSATAKVETKQPSPNAPAPIDGTSTQDQELFQRSLLAARFQFESQSKPNEEDQSSSTSATTELQAKAAPVSPEPSSAVDEPKAEEVVVEPPKIEKSPAPPAAEPTSSSTSQGESVELIRDFLSQPPSKPSPISVSNISESRLKSIVEARRQPKENDKEASVAEKYSNMSVEERAFSILFDLGMVEANKDPKDPSYDHSDDDDYCEHFNLPS